MRFEIEERWYTMSKVAIIYYSQTGNTKAMAEGIAEGVRANGGEAILYIPQEVKPYMVRDCTGIALGCPAMRFEQLDDDIFEPAYEAIKPEFPGKKIALFGSYGWGGGEWMRTWEEEIAKEGVQLAAESVICCETPNSEVMEECRQLGKKLC
jgi:flavodoxin short chain